MELRLPNPNRINIEANLGEFGASYSSSLINNEGKISNEEKFDIFAYFYRLRYLENGNNMKLSGGIGGASSFDVGLLKISSSSALFLNLELKKY